MGKKRALARVCEVFSLEDMMEMCRKVGLAEQDKTLIRQRFYDDVSRELCDMPVGVQRRRVPIMECYIVSEVLRRRESLPEFQRVRLWRALGEG